MKYIDFDWNSDARVLGVSLSAFDRLGLSEHLPHYEIITAADDNWHDQLRKNGTQVTSCGMKQFVNVSELLASTCVSDHVADLKKEGVSPLFLITNVTDKAQLSAKRLDVPLLANPVPLRQQFENKAQIRESSSLHTLFARFIIRSRSQLDEARSFEQLKQEFFPFVIQNESEQLSGSRGTAVVYSLPDYMSFLERMRGKGGDRFVISEYITGQPYSVQGCVTSSGVYWAPVQRQIVSDPWLASPGFSQFCGGLWGEDSLNTVAFYQVAERVGQVMKQRGYKGIFGIDFLVEPSGKVYVIEVNARLTGMTPVLSMMQNKHGIPPLLLLHVLEHARVPYTLKNDEEYKQKLRQVASLSYAVLHNRKPYSVQNTGNLRSGIYTFEDNTLQYIRAGYTISDLQSESEFLIPDAPNHSIAAGKMLIRVLTSRAMWSPSRELLPTYQQLIKTIESYFEKVV
ncbi:MAG: ATP-grasp domain-containing protein [Candidatus Andersenbacteria bacterium]